MVEIKKVEIKGLWGRKNIELNLNNNKLILVGENGCGKTTILRIVYEALNCDWSSLIDEEFSAIVIQFDDESKLTISYQELISEFKNKDDEMYGLYDFKRGFGGVVEE